jgi:hypothetical protein
MLKELEDYNWFPKILRRWQTEFIGSVAIWTNLYKPLVPVLNKMITDNSIINLQDCCSGSGAPAIYVHKQLAIQLPLLLTDKYPDESFTNKPPVVYSVHPADVLQMQPVENILYTMYNAFHHFSAEHQQYILQKMAATKTPFLIAELLEPGFISIIKIFFTTTLGQIFTAPFVQPFSLSRLFFTYIIPVNLFTITYDGIISVLKSKTVKQYNMLIENISTPNYTINVSRVNNIKGNVVYIKGEPTNK